MLEDRDWYKRDGASSSTIERLKQKVNASLPESYFELLAYSDGGEGPLPVLPFNFVLDAADTVRQQMEDGTFEEFFAGLVVFGGNGGGEAIAFDVRGAMPYPIVAFDITNTDLDEGIERIAPDFDAFLKLVGNQS